MPRTEGDARRELDLWEADFERHAESCPICDRDKKVYCAEGSKLLQICSVLMVELMQLAMPRVIADGDRAFSRIKRRMEAKEQRKKLAGKEA